MSRSDEPESPRSEPESEPGRGPGVPMNAVWATGWTLGLTVLFVLLTRALAMLRPGAAPDLVSGVLCQAIAYCVGLFLILRIHTPETGIRDLLGIRPTHWLFYPLSVLLGVALQIPATSFFTYLERVTHDDRDPIAEMFQVASMPGRALIALVIILFGPMLEEILFRGALFRPMLKVHPVPMVILVTGTLFALVHGKYQVYLPIGVMGVFLGMLRYSSGSLVPPILMHASFNSVTFYAMAARAAHTAPGASARPEGTLPWTSAFAVSTAVVLLLVGSAHLLGLRTLDARLSREYDKQ